MILGFKDEMFPMILDTHLNLRSISDLSSILNQRGTTRKCGLEVVFFPISAQISDISHITNVTKLGFMSDPNLVL